MSATLEEEIVVPEHLRKQKKKYLKNERPEIFKQLHPHKNKDIDIDKLTVGSTKRVWWLCLNNHEWETTVSSRTQIGKGNCPYCWRDREINGNNFTKTHPNLTKFWNKKDNGDHRPETSTTRDGIRINFTCDKRHQFSRMLYNSLPDLCPKCKIQVRRKARLLSNEDAAKVKQLYKEGMKKIDIAKKWEFIMELLNK